MRIIGIVGILLLLVPAVFADEQEPASSPHAKPKLTLAGDTALLTVAVRPEKSADFEQVISKMKAALLQSDDPKRREQAAGWKVMKLEKPLPDGNLAYVHVIQPVVPGADYAVMQTLYDAFPDERQALYELYRGAFVQNLSLATGHIVVDMSKAP
ncbi:MAG TPA: hypothetical protein VFO21_02810 [Vicinamibacterales bacterium]|nr:hypothetical protein [Vicinamibacterales bacterium]